MSMLFYLSQEIILDLALFLIHWKKILPAMIKHFLQQILLIHGILLLASYDIFCTTGINFKKKETKVTQ